MKRIKTILFSLLIIAIICLLLGSLIALIKPKLLLVVVFMVLGVILGVVVIILHTILWRCKECGRWLGKGLSHKFCPYCGAKVDSESEE